MSGPSLIWRVSWAISLSSQSSALCGSLMKLCSRIVATFVLAFAAFSAHAQSQCTGDYAPPIPAETGYHDNAEQAYTHCGVVAEGVSPFRLSQYEYAVYTHCEEIGGTSSVIAKYQTYTLQWGPCQLKNAIYKTMGNAHPFAEKCPPGDTWNEATKTCFEPDECLKRNAELGNTEASARPWQTRCIAGCKFGVAPGQGPLVAVEGLVSAKFAYTGEMCDAVPMPPREDEKPKEQECKPAGAGQTLCLKPNGDHCYSASSGRQICWKPGQTGEQNDGPNKQKRDAGPNPIPPSNLQLPSGDTLTKNGTSTTTTTTVTNNSTTTNITTTTTNYTTTNGTNAGNTNDGENSDGSGKDKGDGKGASGGGDCKTPPIVTGDAILGMVATQAWATRCAVEAGNTVKVTGDVGDCKSPFTVQGTDANAVKLRAMRAQICNGDKDGDGQPDWTKPDGSEPGDGETDQDGSKEVKSKTFGVDMLDSSGFIGSGSCPQLGVLDFGQFGTFSLDSEPWFCQMVALMRGVLLLVGAFVALRILTGDSV